MLADFEPDETVDLGPGDLLYLPPRVAHHGIALDDDCMTYSVGFRAPSYADMLSDYAATVAAAMDETDRYADPGMAPAEHPGQIRDEDLARVRGILRSAVADDAAIHDWFGRFATQPARGYIEPLAEPYDAAEILRAIREGVPLRRGMYARLAYVAHDDGTSTLYAGGDARPLAARLAFAAPLLTDREIIPPGDLGPHLDDPAFTALVTDLVNDGLLELDEGV
jgi:50S ribosomal protein L16 3-hydroxylase